MDILNELPHNAKDFTFYTNRLPTRIFRPHYQYLDYVKLTIFGNTCINISDAIVDILLTFPQIIKLELHKIYFSRNIIAALSSMKIEELILNNCTLPADSKQSFLQALYTSKNTLTSLTINANGIWSWHNTIHYLNARIALFQNLKSYNFPISLQHLQTKMFKKLERSKSLKQLHLTNICYEGEENDPTIESKIHLKNIKVTITSKLYEPEKVYIY